MNFLARLFQSRTVQTIEQYGALLPVPALHEALDTVQTLGGIASENKTEMHLDAEAAALQFVTSHFDRHNLLQ